MRITKEIAYQLFAGTRVSRLARPNDGKSVVLAYHDVYVGRRDPVRNFDGMRVRMEHFEWQMEYLAANYRVVSLDQILEPRVDGRGRKPLAAITFDDGYRNTYRYALPVLRRLRLPATVFIYTDFLLGRAAPWWDRLRAMIAATPRPALQISFQGTARWFGLATIQQKQAALRQLSSELVRLPNARREALLGTLASGLRVTGQALETFEPLSLEEVQKMVDAGIVVGSHARSHDSFLHLTRSDLAEELTESKRVLESVTGRQVTWLAYPYGQFTPESMQVAEEAGYRGAVAALERLNDGAPNPYAISRFGVDDNMSRAHFIVVVSGLRDILARAVPTGQARAARILLIGDYPPPYGGISVQLAYLNRRLSHTPGYGCRVLDIGASRRVPRTGCVPVRTRGEFAWQLLRHAARGDIIHLHTNGHQVKSWLVGLACGSAGLLNGRKTVLSVESGAAPEFVTAARGPIRLLIRFVLGLATIVICRNERTKQALAAVGGRPEKITILSGFYGVATEGLPDIPPEVAAFLNRHVPVAAAQASREPEYGIPLLLEAASRLRHHYPQLGLLLIGPGHGAPSADGVLMTGELPHELALSVMRKAHVFVRPSYFDGDALSVREALALGIPVVASDTDFRPEGVILFRRGDLADLAETLGRALNGHPQLPVTSAGSDSFDRLLELYDQLDGRKR